MEFEFDKEPEFSEREYKEKFKSMLGDLIRFDEQVYPEVVALLDELGDVSELPKEKLGQANKLIDAAMGIDVLKTPLFHSYLLNTKSPVKKFISHDLAGVAAALLGYIPSVDEPYRMPDLSILKQIKSAYPAYSLILKDILLKFLENEGEFNLQPKAVEMGMLKQGFEYFFVTSGAMARRVEELFRKQFGGLPENYRAEVEKHLSKMDGILRDDEEVVAEAGVLFNALSNIIRNSCKESVKSSAINFDFKRIGDELVFLVADDGVGMNEKQLRPHLKEGDEEFNSSAEINFEESADPNSAPVEHANPQYIFSEGKESSGTGSTGLGLAQAPERLAKFANARLRVWSRKGNAVVADYNVFPEDNGEEIPFKNLKLEGGNVPVSTIFEIRLPITKKAA